MANLGNTIVNGILRVNGKINASDVISAPSFSGALSGNAESATKLKTARTINGISFDGSANITVADSTKLPLTGGTLSGDLNFSHAGSGKPASIGWNTGTVRQRIRVFDEVTTDNDVFEFAQSKDGGSTYATLMTITADNKVKATTFVGALSGNATSATTSTKLSLPRVSEDANTNYGTSLAIMKEYTNSAKNIPSAHFYHILTGESQDDNYSTQLALGMTTNRLAYRYKSGGNWTSWNTVYTTGNKPTKSDVGLGNVDNTADANKSVAYATSAGTTATTDTNPTSGTWYYPTWVNGTSGNLGHRVNDGYKYYSLQGTTSAVGHSYIQIGNATASGTAGNKQGHLRVYSASSGYTDIVTTTSTSNFTITLPAASGTVSLTSHTHSAATTSANGFMSSTDKTKLNALHYVRSGTSTPASSLGEDGDIYVLLES